MSNNFDGHNYIFGGANFFATFVRYESPPLPMGLTETAFEYANAFCSTNKVVRLLVEEFGADIQELDSEGRNCFHWAAYGGKIHNMEYLNSLDPNLCKKKDKKERTALQGVPL